MLDNSQVLTQVKDTFFDTSEGKTFKNNMRNFIDQFGLSIGEIKDLSVSSLLSKLSDKAGNDNDTKNMLGSLLNMSNVLGIANDSIASLGILN